MTEIAIREEAAITLPAPQLPVPAMNDIDSWTQIVVQVVRLAQEICDTPFVPDGLRGSAPAVSAAILTGREMGLGPMTSLANIDVIRGKPTQKPLLMRAMIQSRGHQWEDIENTDFRAVVRGRRKGESTWATVTFTADQARKAGLDLGKYPADKLYARATSRLAKHKFADVIMGMAYSSDEVEDGLDAEIAVTDGETPAPADEPPKPAARTAQRKQRTQSPPPAQPQMPPTAAPAPPVQPGAGGALPPLPGEEEESSGPAPQGQPAGNEPAAGPDDAPGSERHRKLVGIVQAHFKRLGYNDERREERLVAAAVLAGTGDIETLNDLHPDELSVVADTLAKCRNSDALKALIVAADKEASDGE